ncbi:hypothetical protein ACIGHB_04400 [Streptomyces sp. NPDC085460]|uniref:hypothetical protein n=1 Tax=Streptomyces sp. NPDC085460 TaxID=3365723 RepID=UPI0037D158D4
MSHPARPRARSGRSGRSRRALFLVPALLTALLAPALPAASAADQPPTAPTTAPATAPALATEAPAAEVPQTPQTPQAPQTPETPQAPQAPQAPAEEPTPEPTPTPDPTPTPTPTDASGTSCTVLPLTPLGAAGDPAGSVTLAPDEETCFTVTVEKQGLHRVMRDGVANIRLTFLSGETPVSCERDEADETICPLGPGTYTLRARNHAWAGSLRFAIVPLMPGPGCPEIPGTGYDAAPATGPTPGRIGLVCRSFDGSPGDRIITELWSGTSFVHRWITDDTGRRICPYPGDGGPGCVLPQGSGGYRVLGDLYQAADPTADYRLLVRRMSNPQGCVPITPTPYGTAAVPPSPTSGCRTFTPQESGRYEVRALNARGWDQGVEVYGQNGREVACTYLYGCGLGAGVTYTFFSDDLVELRHRTSTEGCTGDLALSSVHRGSLAGLGETDCLALPAPQGSRVVLRPDDAVYLSVLDSTGTEVCSHQQEQTGTACTLAGTGPHRLLVTSARTSDPTGAYRILVDRADMPGSCRVLPAGDFTDGSPRAELTTGDGVFADCLTIPAADHSAKELLQLGRLTGARGAGLVVFDATGKWICALETGGGAAYEECALTPGVTHTAFFQGHDAPATYTVVRRDVTATAKGCPGGPVGSIGGPSLAGLPGPVDAFHCHQVSAAAGDRVHIALRGAGDTVQLHVYDANGVEVCGRDARECFPTGSTRYQVIAVPRSGTALPAHRVDALRVATATGPPPECARLSDVSHGFGPLTGTLSEQKSALCVLLPAAANDEFMVRFPTTGSSPNRPRAVLYDPLVQGNGCEFYADYGTPEYRCQVRGDARESRPATLVIGLPDQPWGSPTPVRAEADCTVQEGVCGLVPWTVKSVTPGTVGAGKITMTVTGTSLSKLTQVVVEEYNEPHAYYYGATSTTVSVAPDRRSMVVALDLTDAPEGRRLALRVDSRRGVEHRPAPITVVAPLGSTGMVTITGTAAVGGKVTASPGPWSSAPDGYAYQWKANGVAISGATASAYTLPAALQGKQLTVTVTARKTGHPNATASSRSVLVKGVAPKATRAPAMTGSVKVGSKVSASVGTWSPAATSYGYQWRADGVAISGATGSAYTPTAAVRGKKLTVTVTAHRTGHLSGSASTAAVAVGYGVAPKATKAPYLTGTVRVGRTLTLNRGTWTPAPTSYAYQWYANGRAVSGATKSTFVIGKAQRGQKITVKVTAHRTGHTSGYAWTRATGAVAG